MGDWADDKAAAIVARVRRVRNDALVCYVHDSETIIEYVAAELRAVESAGTLRGVNRMGNALGFKTNGES